MNIQFKKGVLEMCVLLELCKGDKYGYEISSSLTKAIDISDGSVYPVLRRLKQDGYVSSYLVESSEGAPRKYYTVTEHGRALAANSLQEWKTFSSQVNMLIENGGIDNDTK